MNLYTETLSGEAHTATAIIPARYHSTRLPGKPLLEIAGRPMILHVVEQTLAASSVRRAIVATDDERVFDAVRQAGFEAALTSSDHHTGSDRIAEVARSLGDAGGDTLGDTTAADVIVNVQGDEPLISPRTIDLAVATLCRDREAVVATTSERITNPSDVLSADVVKVVTDEHGYALYFSRAPIPFPRDAVRQHGSLDEALRNEPALVASFHRHTGLYVYRRRFLLEYTGWPPSKLEQSESLEQLRILERGAKICVAETVDHSFGVDTAEDLAQVRAIIEGTPRGA